MDDLPRLRAEYARTGLEESDLPADPLELFDRWFAEVRAAGVHEPNAMALATVAPDGTPSARFVLLKVLDERGFGFYTNLRSDKARDLEAQPRCSLLFAWHPLARQVRVTGRAVPVPRAEVAAYFATRPRGAQLGAWASRQSRPVGSRGELEQAHDDAARRYPDRVPVPDSWGGYVVAPASVEFWQGRADRMHDRLRYERDGDRWRVGRLAP